MRLTGLFLNHLNVLFNADVNLQSFNFNNITIGDTEIISTVEFSIAKKSTAAIIGPSGCGKTTLLNTIAGIQTYEHLKLPELHNLAYIFQDARLIPWLTVRENLSLIRKTLTQDEIKQALAEVKLDNISTKYPSQLSGGMQRRVSIARAFINKPDMLLLDEPFNSVDTPTAAHLLSLVKQLITKSKTSALLVTHNIKEAIFLAEDIYFLSPKPSKLILHFKNPLFVNSKSLHDYSDPRMNPVIDQLMKDYPNILSGHR